MKILFISLLLPHQYADHASAFTVFNVIKHLSKKHDISLISFARSEEEQKYSESLKSYCSMVKTVVMPQSFIKKLLIRACIFAFKPISVSNSHCREMYDMIKSVTRNEHFDVVQIEYTPMGQYLSAVNGLTTLINVHDLMYVVAKRHAENMRFSRRKLEWLIDSIICSRYEARLYRRFDRVLTLSQKNKEFLIDCNSSLDVSVIPPGVDVCQVQESPSSSMGNKLIFMGAMWRSENVDAILYFYRSVFGLIRNAVPDVHLYIIGGSPSKEVTDLSSDPHVKVTGYVENIHPYYNECDVSVAPIRIAGGVMCKILDAMAAGLPVVTTSKGNEGVGAKPDEEILVSDTAEGFANKIITLLQDGQLRREISQNGIAFIRRNFDWEQIVNRMEVIYHECTPSSSESLSNIK